MASEKEKARARERAREWYHEHKNDPEYKKRSREACKRYKQRNREKVAKMNRAWREAHKETHNEKKRIDAKKYYQENKEACRARVVHRRAVQRNVSSEPWTHNEIAAAGTGLCPYCGIQIGMIYDSIVMHIDHIIPLSRGGTNLIENLEPICVTCNLSKHDKTKEEYLEWLETV